MIKFLEFRKWNGGCQGLWRGAGERWLFNGDRVSVQKDKKRFGDGCW